MPGRVHLVCGSTGAGKSRYARRLAEEVGGVHFAIDEWMAALFWPDSPQPIDPAWAIERVGRCSAMIWRTAAQVARRGVDVLLEVGLTRRADRARFAALARREGLELRLHFVDAPVEERWRRVEARNSAEDHALPFAIDRAMFDFVEAIWEAPDEAEMRAFDGIRV